MANNKSDCKAFKFSENYQEMKALKRDTVRISEIERQNNDGVVKNVPQVNKLLASRDRDELQTALRAASPSRTEGSKERKKKRIVEDAGTIKLGTFPRKHNKGLVENYEMDQKMLDSDVGNKTESTKGTLEIKASLSIESKHKIKNGSNKDVFDRCESKNLKMEDEENTDARDVRLLDCSAEKIGHELQLIKKDKKLSPFVEEGSQITERMMANGKKNIMVASIEADLASNDSSESESSDSPTKTTSGSQQWAFYQHLIAALQSLKAQEGISETSSNQDSFQQHDLAAESKAFPSGPPACPTALSGKTLHSGSISSQSNRSNASANSFVFPILPSEWNGSPARMVKAERRQLRKQGRWKTFIMCCKF